MRVALIFKKSDIFTGPGKTFLNLAQSITNFGVEVKTIEYLKDPITVYKKLADLNPDVLHFNKFQISQLVYSRRWKSIATVHGDLHWTMPDYLNLPRPIRIGYSWTQQIRDLFCSRALDYVLPVSNYLAKSLKKHLTIPREKLKVIHHGVDHNLYKPKRKVSLNLSNIFEKHGISKGEYILHIANRAPKKNSERLFKAFQRIPREYGVDLVIPGARWLGFETPYREIKHIGFIPEKDLPSLYSNALMLVNPSLHETFGMPYLEAMACGCPVIGSNNTAIPEVVGDAGILINNPKNTEEIYNAMKELLSNSVLRKKLSRKGIRRAKKFRWIKSAEEVVKIYEELGHRRGRRN